MSNWKTRLTQIRAVYTDIMAGAPHMDLGLVPNPSASKKAIARAERRIGRALPPSYREFLAEHDGWPRFFEGASLLGTSELGKKSYADLARAVFEAAETPVPDIGPPSRPGGRPSTIIPFGIDPQGTSLFAFNPDVLSPSGEMQVIAWVSEIGARSDDFEDFLRMALDISRADLAALTELPHAKTG